MRKFYTLLAAVVTTATFAQTNLVPNGGFENWDSDTFPTGFSPAPYTSSVSKEATIKKSGEFSAKQISTSSTEKVQIQVTGIEAGEQYTISYWYLDNDTKAATRFWGFWLKPGETEGTYTTLPDNESELRGQTFSVDNPEWILKTVTLTAPEETTAFRFEVRTYKASNNSMGGAIYYDDFSIVKTTGASLKDNNIEGLAIYPNPATDQINIASNGIGTKQVTIFDLVGKKVIETSTNQTVNVSGLKAGIYLVNVQQDGKSATRKLVIK